jgi:hypothetical protein
MWTTAVEQRWTRYGTYALLSSDPGAGLFLIREPVTYFVVAICHIFDAV